MPSTPVSTWLAPRFWAAHLLALVCVGAAGMLGAWQYDGWQEQREAEAVDRTRSEPVPLATAMGPDDPFPGDRVGQPVVIAGTWVPDGTVLVSGRERAGESGYWAVTPLATEGPDGPAIPVVRGWTSTPDAAPAPPTGEAELVGLLQLPEGSGETDPDLSDDVLPQVRIADLIQRVDQDLYGAYAVATARGEATNAGSAGLEPATLEQLPDVGRFTGVRNLLYAIEWWIFGAFALYMWWRYLRDALDPEPSHRGQPGAEPPDRAQAERTGTSSA